MCGVLLLHEHGFRSEQGMRRIISVPASASLLRLLDRRAIGSCLKFSLLKSGRVFLQSASG